MEEMEEEMIEEEHIPLNMQEEASTAQDPDQEATTEKDRIEKGKYFLKYFISPSRSNSYNRRR